MRPQNHRLRMLMLERSVLRRAFSIIEALIALGLVLLALSGVFSVVPYAYRAIQDDSLRAEATAAAQRYLDDVRLAVQTGEPVPGPTQLPLALGSSIATGQTDSSTARVDLSASCGTPSWATASLYDCVVSIDLAADGHTRTLPSIESYITRQLP